MITSLVSSNFPYVAVHTFLIVLCVRGFFYQLSLTYCFLTFEKDAAFRTHKTVKYAHARACDSSIAYL
jgi:hypothetical protein